jgi:predicted phosphoadenosine phosphosulfate sulfurtransferase
MSKQLALQYIKDSIHADIRLGWTAYLVDAPISTQCKISQIDDMKQCWNANNLQELLSNMIKG